MDLLLILTYAGLCVAIFKIFKIPLNKWSVPTAILGGIALISTLLILMNYNHPYGKYAKEAFITVPIVPAVKGTVVKINAQPNVPLKGGDVLFQIDPRPFQFVVDRKKAQLAEAEQLVKQNAAQLQSAKGRVAKAKADRDRAKQTYDRYAKGKRSGAFSEQQIASRRQLYRASEGTLSAAQSEYQRIKLMLESEVDGVNTKVAQLRADLTSAQYDLERTVVRAPADGMVTQVALRPGSMAVSLPLRPAMVFIPNQGRTIVGSFWQNSLTKMKPGFEAEVILDAVPGHVFKGKVKAILPAMSEGEIQSGGNLVSARQVAAHGRALASIELEEDLNSYNLPLGVQGKVAIYSDSFTHVSVIRRVLLRMLGWINYVFPMK
jgi:multidrug resistance efflux pump